jgi:Domain of unknown function (DUF4157)
MTGRRLETKPELVAQRQRGTTPSKTSSVAQKAGRLPRTLEAKTVSPAQLEAQQTAHLEIQRARDLEVAAKAVQRAHLERSTQARVTQTKLKAASTRSAPVQRAVSEHLQSARAAQTFRAAFIAQRSADHLEGMVAGRLEHVIRPPLEPVQRQSDLTLSHVADHTEKTAVSQISGNPDALRNLQGFKNAGATLVNQFRAPGTRHTMPQLVGAIQRFRDPWQRAAVEASAYAAFGSHPSFPGQLQRALDEQDAKLEVQREAWKAELEPTAQRLAEQEASGENAAGLIEGARGGGQPLPENVRAMLETKWNTDLSRVKIHTDSSADVISKKLNAKALASGHNIFFRAGGWNPTSLEGLQLIAHETWHTVQQAGGLVQAGVDKSHSLELEARGKGAELSSGDLNIASSGSGLQRKGSRNVTKHTDSAPARAVQRDKADAQPLAPPRATQQPGGGGINVPIDASVDTKKELMVRVLVRLGYDQGLAEASTNANGDFEFGDDSRHWVTWRKPTSDEIKQKSIHVEISAAEQTATQAKAASANLRFRAGVGSTKAAADGFRVIVQERLYKRGEVKGQPAIVGEPALKTVPIGSKIDYAFEDGEGPSFRSSDYRDPRSFRWYVRNDPKAVRTMKQEIVEGPSKAVWSGEDWDFAGDHTVVLEVTSPKEKLRILFVQRVADPEGLAKNALGAANSAPDFVRFRAGLEMQSIDLSGGGLLEGIRSDGRIRSSGTNPAPSASNITADNPPPQYSYEIKPTPGATRFAWSAEPQNQKDATRDNLFGYTGKTVAGRLRYTMPGSAPQSRFVIAWPDTYLITCEEFNAQGQQIGTASYAQVVLSGEQQQQFNQWQGYVAATDKAIRGLREGKEVPIKAVFLNQETAQTTALNLYIGPGVKGGVTLLDLTPGAPRIEFAASDAQAALALFDEANKYPTGRIALHIPKNASGMPELERNIATDGRSSLSTWADGLGWTSLGLAGAGLVAAIIPGGQVAAGYLFVAAVAAGGLSGGAGLADELKQARPSGVKIAVDVLSIASSVVGGGAAARGLRALATGGEVALTKAIAGRTGQFLILTDFALGGAQGVIIAASSVAEIDAIAQSGLSREEKIGRIVRILVGLAANGLLLAYGAKNLSGEAGGVARVVSQNEQRVMDSLPAGVRRSTPIVENKSLQPGQVRVASDAGPLGTVRNVRLEFNGSVRPQDVELHLEAFQTLKSFEGMSGKFRALQEDLKNWIKQNGEPKKLSEAWYAEQEIIKIKNAIRQARQDLSSTPLSKAQASVERAQIRYWQQEIERHRVTLKSGSRARGPGVIEMPTGPGGAGQRVRTPIKGLYDSVDITSPPSGWGFRDAPIQLAADGTRTLETTVLGPNGTSGLFIRLYNPKTQKLELLEAFLGDLPSQVGNASLPLVASRGTPTVTYMTLYQMRRLGVSFGEVKTVKMSTIQNFKAILKLETLRRQGIPLDRAVLQTHSVEYAETSIIQSGSQIVSAKVSTAAPAKFAEIGDLMAWYESREPALKAQHDALLSQFGLKRTDKMWLNYDILLEVKPLSPGQIAPPL